MTTIGTIMAGGARHIAALAAAATLCIAPAAGAQTLRLVAPFAAGGAADTVARHLAAKLHDSGQSVIVENRAGAGGAIGAAYVAAAPADGFTLLVTLGPPHQTLPLFQNNVGYDPVRDFTPILIVGTAPQALIVPASSPAKSAAELVELSRKAPKGLTYATSGIGSSQHLAGLLLVATAKANLVHVAYKGGGPAMTDVLGGQTDAGILVLSNALPHVQSGKLRVLGVVEGSRAKSAPQIPTVAEGVAGFAIPPTWVGVLGPKGMAQPVLARIHADLSAVIADPQVRKRLEGAGYEVTGSTPQEFARQLADSVELYRKVTAQAGIKPE